jgi:uncharacterized membrane protein YedE/YeeE
VKPSSGSFFIEQHEKKFVMIEFISQPWHWAISGAAIAVLMFLMLLSGEKFGISTSFETVCSMSGVGKWVEHFDFDWKTQKWLLMFVAGAIIGGLIASTVLRSPDVVAISETTISDLEMLGVSAPSENTRTNGFVPEEIFTFASVLTLKGFMILVVGGFLIGFGTRYASGCTSGHAISGLANLQLASLIAVVGFFIGGLASTYFLMPWIMGL